MIYKSLLLALVVALLPSVARADATSHSAREDYATASAREHYATASRAYDVGDYDEAIREFTLAYKAKDDPTLLYNLGQAHRLAGHRVEALRAYRNYLIKVPGAPNRAEVQHLIDELKQPDSKPVEPKPVPPVPTVVPVEPAPVVTPVSPAVEVAVAAPPPSRPKRKWVLPVAVVGGVVVIGLAVGLGVGLGAHPSNPHANEMVTGP